MRPPLIRIVLRAAGCALPVMLAAGCAAARPSAAMISTSRLGIAKAPGTVAPGVVQVEAGYSQAHQDGRTRHTFGETLVRVGVGPRTEARAGIPSYQRTVTDAATVEGLADGSLSVKHRLRDAAGWLPAFAVTAGSTVPVGAEGVGAGAFQPEAAVSAEWKLPHGLRAIAMASHRSAVAADDRFGVTTLSAAGRAIFAPGMMGQVEHARVASTRAGAADVHHLRAGAAVRITPNLQMDAWAGRATANGTREHLFGLGFARRW